MVESESKFGRILISSWADEVEKEEKEEEVEGQQQQKLKPNPFGSARPREVVLQEKGIDWRILDLHLQQKSKIRQDLRRNDKSSKENNLAPSLSVFNRLHSEPSSKCAKQRLKNENLGFNLSAASNHMPVIVVPPLRYPPRNMVATLPESRVFCNLYGFNVGQQWLQYKCNLKPEKKKTIHVNREREVHRSRNFSPIHCNQQISIEQLCRIKKSDRKVEYGQSLAKGRNFQKPATHSNWQQNVMGSLLGKPPPVQGHGRN